MRTNLYLVTEGRGTKRPVRIAKVTDRDLVINAAQTAIREAEQKAEALGGSLTLQGRLELAEAVRLRTALRTVVPELWIA